MKKLTSQGMGAAMTVGAIVALGGCAGAGGGALTMSMLGMGLTILLTLAGCTTSHSRSDGDASIPEEDRDGDGYLSDVDCDDEDPLVHPDADEQCGSGCESYGDGIDNNCNGEIDEYEACAIYNCFPEDLDGDGWPAPQDCDDANPDVHPDADEQCGTGCEEFGDGIDNNCNGEVDEYGACAIYNCFPEDLDGDGWVAPEDCNDEDPAVNPGVDEICEDAVDNDCDSAVDEPPCLGLDEPGG